MFDGSLELQLGLIPTRFLWRHGGQRVSLVGSFTRWVEPVPLHPVDGSPSVFSVVVHLSPGYHQYKFIVDNVWRHDEQAPCMPDPNGNVNNWVFVRNPEPNTAEVDRNYLIQRHYFLQELQHQIAEQLSARAAGSEDVPMRDDIPHLLTERKEPEYTLQVIHDFLHTHKAFELIPESGKVVVLDVDLSIRQAFHALHEQCIPSAALWDSEEKSIVGVISASDFIEALKQLRESVSSGASVLTAAEMDHHTIRSLKQDTVQNGGSASELFVFVEPGWTLEKVVETLIEKGCSMAPIVAIEEDKKIPSVLHTASLGGVVACLIRHFQASISSLPFLSRPLSALHVGTWSSTAHFPNETPDEDPRCRRKTGDLHVIHPETSLTDAFDLLLEAEVSALPVVNHDNVLVDIYARTDITHLAKNHAYTRLQQEEMSVQQALAIGRESPSIPEGSSSGGAVGGLTASFRRVTAGGSGSGPLCATASLRAHSVTRNDTLRTVVERLANPGIHRLMVIDASTRILEGIISMTDIAKYLFINAQSETGSTSDRIRSLS